MKTWVQLLSEEIANWQATAKGDGSSIRVALTALEDVINSATPDLLTFDERRALMSQLNA